MERSAAIASVWDRLPPGRPALLQEVGATEPQYFRELFRPDAEGARELLQEFGADDTDSEACEALLELHRMVGPAADRAVVRWGYATGPTMAGAVGLARQGAKRLRLAATTAEVSGRLPRPPVPPGAAPKVRFPTRLHRSAALEGGPAGRRKAEEKERRRWLDSLGALVQEAGLPLAEVAAGAANPQGVLDRIAQGRRAATLRRRCRAWTTVRCFLLLCGSRPWPDTIVGIFA